MKSQTLFFLLIALFFFGQGKAQTCGLNFDGVDDAINFTNGVNLSGSSFTLELWVQRQSIGTHDDIFHLGNTTTNQGLHIRFEPSNRFRFGFWNNDFDLGPYPWTTDGQWHHIAATFNSSSNIRSVYVDGVLAGTNNAGTDFVGPAANMIIGDINPAYGGPGNIHFHGNMDDFRIWNVERTQSEIQANMNACVPGNLPGLVAYWKFDDGTGSSTLADATGNGFDGTLVNMDASSDWNAGQICCSPAAVPTLSQWGLIIFGLMVLCLGAIVLVKKRRVAVNL